MSLAVTGAKTMHDMHQALHDSLTGLADPTGDPVALLFIDLDRFKQVNDTLVLADRIFQ